MHYKEYIEEITNKGYKLTGNVFRDKKHMPKCYNPVLQKLLERIQDNTEPLTEREYNLYGYLVMSLVQIVLNNVKFKYQDPDIREECRTEMYCGILEAGPKYFDRTKGSTAYSYLFRVAYTQGIHVLEAKNQRTDIENTLREAYDDYLALENAGKKICTTEVDSY